MNDSTIEQYLRGIGDVVKDLQRLFVLVVVIEGEGLYPGFDFLLGDDLSFHGDVVE